jgi:phosphoribosylamine---glycine ligase
MSLSNMTNSEQSSPKILVVGQGAREHALLHALSQSTQQPQLLIAPGNAGCEPLATLVPIASTDVVALVAFAVSEGITFVVVGPEAPLSLGLVDALAEKGIPAFGPSQACATLESSKFFAKQCMAQAGVPTAHYAYCQTEAEGFTALETIGKPPYVVKEDGLAAGKGVTIATTLEEAKKAVQHAMEKAMPVVIESFLEGVELSLFAICDGVHAVPLPPAQDFKRVGDEDKGLNTGGMGAYSPVYFADEALITTVQTKVLNPMMKTMAERGTPFHGLLYVGLMVHPHQPETLNVVEFNVRFGDPETQVVLPLLTAENVDILALLQATASTGSLATLFPQWVTSAYHPSQLPWFSGTTNKARPSAVTVVMASQGYPEAYPTGNPIHLPDTHSLEAGVMIYYAGTQKTADGALLSAGGRVLSVTAIAENLAQARRKAYQAIKLIDFPTGFNRTDIALKACLSQFSG